MKIKKIHLLPIIGATFMLPLTQAANVIVNFSPNATFPGGPGDAADGPNNTIFGNNSGLPVSFGMTNGGAADFISTTLTAGAISQTFNIEVVLSTNVDDMMGDTNTVNRGGVGAVGVLGGGSATLIESGEVLTISAITLIPADGGTSLFQFDGFSSVFFGNTSVDESATVNGELFTATAVASGTAFTQELELSSPSQTLLIAGGVGGVSLNGVTAEFSVIPEPSSLSLLGLGGLALLRRRR